MRPTEQPKTRGATRQSVRAAWRRHGGRTSEVARHFGVSERTVRRWVVGWGIADAAPTPRLRDGFTPGVLDSLRHGMPALWAVEGTPHSQKATSDWATAQFPERAVESKEWRRVWPAILHNPTLRALHEEFAPKRKVTL
ncbi:helix-turn-helix domain-containing protein [Microbacterium sp. T32]|uniref:helix-turn-helix domain-containing protein n=1 Tax=Microbacterium sp. T32 TaxID=1776083 RepID=UPI000ABA5C5F|nr:helix-turn-helix domain-containing protein [Microbacterium sp. T32]